MSFLNLGWTCDLWFFVAKFECKMSFIFSSYVCGLLLLYPPCFKCSFLAMHAMFFVKWECEHGLKYELWTFSIKWVCEVRGSLVVVAISEAFSFIDFVLSYVLSLVVYNVDPNLSLVALAVLEAFSFVDSFISNVLSLIVLIFLTFSMASLAISKAFCFVSSIVEPTFYFVSPTFFWTFSIVSPVFCYTIPNNSSTFYFNCSKIEPTPESYSS